MNAVLEIERRIEELPSEEFGQLAVWFLQRAEDRGLLQACLEAEEGGLADESEADAVISKLRVRAAME